MNLLTQQWMSPEQQARNQLHQAMDPAGCMHERYMAETNGLGCYTLPDYLKPSHNISYIRDIPAWEPRTPLIETNAWLPKPVKEIPLYPKCILPKIELPKQTGLDYMFESSLSRQRKQKEADDDILSRYSYFKLK